MALPNPSPSCGVPVGCCNPVKEVLIATFENVSDCACIDGLQATLFFDPISFYWEGKGNGTGCSLASETYRVECVSPNSSCSDFRFSTWNGSCIGSPASPNAGCTCHPLNLVFETTLNGFSCCNQFPGTGTIRVTVTE